MDDRCPYCGGTTGYYKTSVVTVRYGFDWDGSEQGWVGEPSEHRKPMPVRCIDCGRRVKDDD